MNQTSDSFSALTFEHEGMTYLRPCSEVILYWSGSVFDHAGAILAFHDRAVQLIGDRLKFFRTETMGAARALKKDTLGLVRFWLQDTATPRDVYMLFLESGAVADEPSSHAFAFSATPGNGHVRLVLPPEFANDKPEEFVALVQALTGNFKFDFGTAGFGVHWNWLGKHARRAQLAMNSLSSRFCGVDLNLPMGTQFIVGHGFKCINWLTLLGPAYVEKLGGSAAIAKAVQPEGSVVDLPHGLLVRADERPSLGDVNRREALLAYERVGHALAPARSPQHAPIFGPGGVRDPDATAAWLARFD